MEEKKLFLLDGMALVYRAFFAFSQNPRITSYGLNTSAIYGFANTVMEVIKNQRPTHIAVAFDTKEQTNRAKEHSFYKAHREEMPEDLAKSLPYVFKLLEGMNIPVIMLPGWEADDVIGTLAIKAANKNFMTYMMTPDKDFGQLVTDKIIIYKPARLGNGAEILGVNEILAKWEIKEIKQVIDILGLWGDASDNIPGVPGVGEKTAKKLIATYGSMENVLANLDDLKGKMKENFENYREQALISKSLATIDLNSPIEFEEEKYVLEPYNEEALLTLFNELEFRTMAQRMFNQKPVVLQTDLFGNVVGAPSAAQAAVIKAAELPLTTISNQKVNYTLVTQLDAIEKLANSLLLCKTFCFDTETTGLNTLTDKIIGISFAITKGEAYYVPINNEDCAAILALLKPVFENNAVKIGQNIKFDYQMLRNENIELKLPFFDTMIAHYLLEPDMRHGMDKLAEQYLNYNTIGIDELIGKKGKGQLNMADVPLETIKDYAAEDADITLQLKEAFEPLILAQNAGAIFNELELPLIPVLADMERAGIGLDVGFLNNYTKSLATEIVALEANIYKLAGVKFNIASPKQLGEILFDKLQLDLKAKKTKTGQYKTGEDILQKLYNKSEIVQHVMDFRQLQKLKSTYVDALPLLVNQTTQRIHTTYNQAVAATGRLSSTNPNLQNIPIRTARGREVRKAFIPSVGNILLSADYSQVELRVVASISGDIEMIKAFKAGLDIHTATAAKVFGVAIDQVTKEQRYKAKSVNFGLIYGQGAFGLAENLGISRTEAKEIIDNYFIQFPGIKDYMDDTIAFARSNGYVQTLLGRRRYIKDINSANQTVRGFAERNAINAPIQGTAADMIKIAMIEIHAAIKEQGFKSKMILQVHDELLFDVFPDELTSLKSMILKKMATALPLKVPVLAEAGEGNNWLEAH